VRATAKKNGTHRRAGIFEKEDIGSLLERRKNLCEFIQYLAVSAHHCRGIGSIGIRMKALFLSMQIKSSKLGPLRFNGPAADRVSVKELQYRHVEESLTAHGRALLPLSREREMASARLAKHPPHHH
jgi:hypothetical protein